MSGLNHRLQCYFGYTDPTDLELVFFLHGQCKETYPFVNWGPQPAVTLALTNIPQIKVAALSIGSCPEGNYSWHPRIYIDWANAQPPADGWFEYPGAGDTEFFVCSV